MSESTQMRSIHDLRSLVPDPSLVDDYASRQWGGYVDLDLIHAAGREMKHNILLYGDTGSAKTMVAMAYAARESLPFYSVPLNGATDVQTMLGKFIPTESGTFKWVDGPVTAIVRNGGVLLLDEINMPHPKMMAVLYPLLDARRVLPLLDHEGEIVTAHKDVVIVGTMNPDYEGTRPLNAALRNRFAVQCEWGYRRDVEAQLVTSESILEVADKLRAAFRVGDLTTPTPTNRLMEFDDFAETFGMDFAIDNFVAGYEPEEQTSVRQTLELYRERIDREIAEASAA
jgi:MoxR-like ATPase